MTVYTNTILSTQDLLSRLDPDGSHANYANLLKQGTGILDDAMWMPSNDVMSSLNTVVTGLPDVFTRRFNEGVASSHGSTNQFRESCMVLETQGTTDVLLARAYGNSEELRAKEGRLRAEAMKQAVVNKLFEANPADNADDFLGLRARYDSSSDETWENVFDCGGTGSDLSSIYLICWSEDCHLQYPKNMMAGLDYSDLGIDLIQTDTQVGGAKMEAYVDIYRWAFGWRIQDWKNVVRAANIVPDDVLTLGTNQTLTDYDTNIMYVMDRMVEHIPYPEAGRCAWYMPRAIKEGLSIQALARTTPNVFKTEDVEGKKVQTYLDYPIRIIDKLGNAETAAA